MAPMDELRCEKCDKLLMKARLSSPSSIELPCPRCSHLNVISVETPAPKVELVSDGQGGYLTKPVG